MPEKVGFSRLKLVRQKGMPPPPVERSPYVELGVTTPFSFLRGASDAIELVLTALKLGYDAIGVADRYRFVEGDLLEVDFGAGYHAAVLGHILHSEGEARSQKEGTLSPAHSGAACRCSRAAALQCVVWFRAGDVRYRGRDWLSADGRTAATRRATAPGSAQSARER